MRWRLAVLLGFVAAPLEAAEVTSVVVGRIYFDAGEGEGLVEGREVDVKRGGRAVGSCVIDHASRRNASCAFVGGRRGDVGLVRGEAPPAPAPMEAPSPDAGPGLGGPSAPNRAGALAAAAIDRVEHAATATPDQRLRAEASVGHTSYLRADGDGTHRQRIDAAVRDIRLGFLNARAHVDLTVITYAARPGAARFRNGASAQLYVHETAIESRTRTQTWSAAVGRIRPWHAPGVPYLDGVQLGLRLFERRLELGILAGGLPDPIALEPSPERWLAGVYAATETRDDELWTRTRLRAGVANAPTVGARGELEGGFRLAWGRALQLAADARGLFDDQGADLASIRGSVGSQPTAWLRFDLDGRIRNPQLDYAGPSSLVGAEHASAAARFRVLPSLQISAIGGYGRLSEESFGRGWAGLEADFARLFGAEGGLSTGYQEAVGDLPGRTLYVQLDLHPDPSFDLLTRLSGFMDDTEGTPLLDIGAYAHADWRISTPFALRASLMSRTPVVDVGDGSLAAGLLARLTLVGRL